MRQSVTELDVDGISLSVDVVQADPDQVLVRVTLPTAQECGRLDSDAVVLVNDVALTLTHPGGNVSGRSGGPVDVPVLNCSHAYAERLFPLRDLLDVDLHLELRDADGTVTLAGGIAATRGPLVLTDLPHPALSPASDPEEDDVVVLESGNTFYAEVREADGEVRAANWQAATLGPRASDFLELERPDRDAALRAGEIFVTPRSPARESARLRVWTTSRVQDDALCDDAGNCGGTISTMRYGERDVTFVPCTEICPDAPSCARYANSYSFGDDDCAATFYAAEDTACVEQALVARCLYDDDGDGEVDCFCEDEAQNVFKSFVGYANVCEPDAYPGIFPDLIRAGCGFEKAEIPY